ncbi:MAG: pentapeptide repeat-containing protein [Streptosporangiaceae bacterium]
MSQPPQLADLPWAAALSRCEDVPEADGEYDAAQFEHGAWAEPDARGAVFTECAFCAVSVQGGRLRGARFNGAWLRDLQLAGTDLARTSWQEATLIGSVAAGVEAFGSVLRQVGFYGCKLDTVNFRDAALTDVRFENCLLRNVHFGEARLTRTVFSQCKLTMVDFTKAVLDQADLRTCELDIIAGPQSLRGAIITPGQLTAIAPALAQSLGIIVAES